MRRNLFTSMFSALMALLVMSGGSANAVVVIYEPFDDGDMSLNGNTAGTGLTGNWSASGQFTVEAGALSYGALPTSGNQVVYGNNGAGGATSSVLINSDLNDAGLVNDGSTLWFSVLVRTPTQGGTNPDTGFAFGTDPLRGGNNNNVPMNNNGQGIGWSIKNNQLRAATWENGSKNQAAGAAVATDTTILVVGEILWGATDTINLYLPDTDLNMGAIVSTQTGALSQGAFDTITGSLKSNTGYGFDEIRFGESFDDVIGVVTNAVPEPATAALGLMGIVGLLGRRRRTA